MASLERAIAIDPLIRTSMSEQLRRVQRYLQASQPVVEVHEEEASTRIRDDLVGLAAPRLPATSGGGKARRRGKRRVSAQFDDIPTREINHIEALGQLDALDADRPGDRAATPSPRAGGRATTPSPPRTGSPNVIPRDQVSGVRPRPRRDDAPSARALPQPPAHDIDIDRAPPPQAPPAARPSRESSPRAAASPSRPAQPPRLDRTLNLVLGDQGLMLAGHRARRDPADPASRAAAPEDAHAPAPVVRDEAPLYLPPDDPVDPAAAPVADAPLHLPPDLPGAGGGAPLFLPPDDAAPVAEPPPRRADDAGAGQRRSSPRPAAGQPDEPRRRRSSQQPRPVANTWPDSAGAPPAQRPSSPGPAAQVAPAATPAPAVVQTAPLPPGPAPASPAAVLAVTPPAQWTPPQPVPGQAPDIRLGVPAPARPGAVVAPPGRDPAGPLAFESTALFDAAAASNTQAVCERCWAVFPLAEPACPDTSCRTPRPGVGWPTLPYPFRNRYQFIKQIGRGSMGAVFEAREDGGAPRAIKVMKQRSAKEAPRLREMFEQEIRAASLLGQQDCYVRVSAFDANGDLPFLEMELVEWPTLRELLRGERLTPEQVARLGIAVLDGLDLMHEHNMVHRDLKPANLFVDRRGDGFAIKIADLGGWSYDSRAQAKGIGIREIVGTIPYLSPEQTRIGPLTTASDIFAVGAISWEAATGQLPFGTEGHGLAEQLEHRYDVCRKPPPRPDAMPKALYRVLCRAMSHDAAKRPTAGQMREELRAFLSRPHPSSETRASAMAVRAMQIPGQVPSAAPAPAVQASSRSPMLVFALVLAVLAVAAAVGIGVFGLDVSRVGDLLP